MPTPPPTKTIAGAAAGLIVLVIIVAAAVDASAKMRSERIDRNVCMTTGGGRFVKTPEFRGEKIDRRLLADVSFLARKYKVLITDGYSLDPIHASNGEHPIGLAADIVPNFAAGGKWRDINRLARWAEPRQNHPRAPFRWVGYKGDVNHGPRNHLHLSWDHSETRYNKPARTVYSIKCPTSGKPPAYKPDPAPEPTDPVSKEPGKSPGGGSGGIRPGEGDSGGGSGGIGSSALRSSAQLEHRLERRQNAASSVETDGVGLR